jgi:hypothetical protein
MIEFTVEYDRLYSPAAFRFHTHSLGRPPFLLGEWPTLDPLIN